MDVAVVATNRGGTVTGGARSWDVVSPSEVAVGRHLFQRVLYLALPTGGGADGLALNPEDTIIAGNFASYDYDARDVAEPALRAQVQATSGDHVIVTLPAPREIRRIRVRSALISGSGNRLALHRLDGTVRAEEPTVTASVASNGVATFSGGFIDVRFGVGLNRSDGSGVNLSASDMEELTVRAYPTFPRLAFTDPDALASLTPFWEFPGEVVAASADARVKAGATFAEAFQRYVDSLSGPLPPLLEFALVIRSDAPCRITVSGFNLRYRLKRRSFPSGERKKVLRFPGDAVTCREAAIELPSAATVHSARMSVAESFGPDRPGALADGEGDTGGQVSNTSDDLMAQRTGLAFGLGQWAVQSFVPPRATATTAVLLALLALEPPAEVRVYLQDDWQGVPSGNNLADGSITLEQAGSRAWVAVRFPKALIIPAQPHWLLLTTASGRALWLLRDAPGEGARLLERAQDGPGLWYERTRLDGQVAFYTFLSVRPIRGLSTGAEPATSRAPVTLTVGDTAVPELAPGVGEARPKGTRVLDLKNALALALAGASGDGAVSNVPLRFTSALAGLLTVYPPDIEYDL